jgi:hypothetical protein
MLITASESLILTLDISARLRVKVYHLDVKKIMEIRDRKRQGKLTDAG